MGITDKFALPQASKQLKDMEVGGREEHSQLQK